MEENNNPNISKTLAVLQNAFVEQLSDRMAEIDSFWHAIVNKQNIKKSLSSIHIKIHSLAGSGGTFGAMSISNAAKQFEDKIKECIEEDAISDSQLTVLQSSYKHLQEAVANWCPDSGPHVLPPNKYEYTQHFNNLIYLIDDDPLITSDLARLFESFNYKVVCFDNLEEFQQTCNESEKPGAIIMDLVFEEGDIAGADVIQRLRQEWKEFPPVIFISVRDDVQARLATVRAGASR